MSEVIAFAQSRLVTTMAELRGLARGQHPALLSQAGLASALGSLAQLSGRVQVHVAPQLVGLRFAPVVEATAWFVASEGVVNALKYTDAGVKVTADVADGLRVQIIDTGDGGVDFTPGGGAGAREGSSISIGLRGLMPPLLNGAIFGFSQKDVSMRHSCTTKSNFLMQRFLTSLKALWLFKQSLPMLKN